MKADSIADTLSSLLDLPIVVSDNSRPGTVEFRVKGITRPHGFSVVVRSFLSKVRAELVLDRLAADLLLVVGKATDPEWAQAEKIIDSYAVLGVEYKFEINGESVHNVVRSGPPPAVQTIICTAVLSRNSHDEPSLEITRVAEGIFSAFLCLLPLDQQDRSGPGPVDFYAEVEGRQTEIVTSRYERSRSNRAAAIAIHGRSCAVCRFNFDEVYGNIADGYIEVHHLTPVSMMGEARPVDPVSELVPLCSNCHRMAHRRWPPYTPLELTAARNSRSASHAD